MSEPAFFQTRMGKVFFDVTMPKVADHLGRLTATLQAISDALQASHLRPADTDVDPPPAASDLTIVCASSNAPDVMEMLAQIARQHLGFAALEDRKRDSHDFHDVSVQSVTAALRAAYQTGFAAGVRRSAH
jgi:hypothetical protein